MINYLLIFSLFIIHFFESDGKGIAFILLIISSIIFRSRLVKKNIVFDRIDLLFLLFFVIAGIGNFFSLSLPRSWFEYISYVAYFVIFSSIRRFDGAQRSAFRRYFITGLIIVTLVFSFFPFLINLFPILRKYLDLDMLNLYYPTYGHNHLAGLLILVIPIILNNLIIGNLVSRELKKSM